VTFGSTSQRTQKKITKRRDTEDTEKNGRKENTSVDCQAGIGWPRPRRQDHCPRLMNLLREKGMQDVIVLVGGIIPEADIPAMKQSGIAEIFLPGTSTQDIVAFIHKRVAR